jgi:hypothetical protein
VCARRIIAARLAPAVYIEPYPKSLTKQLHSDATSIDFDTSAPADVVVFVPLNGSGPRRYFDLFEMSMPRKDSTGRAVTQDPAEAIPKIVQFSTYPDLETGHVALLEQNNFFAASLPLIRQGRQQMRNERGWLVIQMSSAKREISGWNGWKKETIRKEISDRFSDLERGESAVVRRQNRAARRQGTEMMALGGDGSASHRSAGE